MWTVYGTDRDASRVYNDDDRLTVAAPDDGWAAAA